MWLGAKHNLGEPHPITNFVNGATFPGNNELELFLGHVTQHRFC